MWGLPSTCIFDWNFQSSPSPTVPSAIKSQRTGVGPRRPDSSINGHIVQQYHPGILRYSESYDIHPPRKSNRMIEQLSHLSGICPFFSIWVHQELTVSQDSTDLQLHRFHFQPVVKTCIRIQPPDDQGSWATPHHPVVGLRPEKDLKYKQTDPWEIDLNANCPLTHIQIRCIHHVWNIFETFGNIYRLVQEIFYHFFWDTWHPSIHPFSSLEPYLFAELLAQMFGSLSNNLDQPDRCYQWGGWTWLLHATKASP